MTIKLDPQLMNTVPDADGRFGDLEEQRCEGAAHRCTASTLRSPQLRSRSQARQASMKPSVLETY